MPSTLRNVWEATCICFKLQSMGYRSSGSSTSMFMVHVGSCIRCAGRRRFIFSRHRKVVPPAAGKIDDSQECYEML